MRVQSFTFNPFAENTFVLYDGTGECAIVDPGCFDLAEQKELADFIADQNLKPVHLLQTHCHIDHIFGIPFVHEKYGLAPRMHKGEQIVLKYSRQMAEVYGTPVDEMPEPGAFLGEEDVVTFGNTSLEIFLTPGHSPASICFFDRSGKQLISGDVLFNGSIGRTDLPGGDYKTLMESIFSKLLTLDDDVKVYPGHMEETTIGAERRTNPFILEWQKR